MNQQMQNLLAQLPCWAVCSVEGVAQLYRRYAIKDFMQAADFVKALADIAQAQDHHPKIILQWGSVEVFRWTHTKQGLDIQDFTMATKTDQIARTYIASSS